MRILSKAVALVAAVVLAACQTLAPIQNVQSASVASSANKPLTTDQVRGAIVRAGSTLGWVMKDDGPGRINGTLLLRTHTAVVDIPYSATDYSILYKSSIDLKEANGQIHKNYNGWIT